MYMVTVAYNRSHIHLIGNQRLPGHREVFDWCNNPEFPYFGKLISRYCNCKRKVLREKQLFFFFFPQKSDYEFIPAMLQSETICYKHGKFHWAEEWCKDEILKHIRIQLGTPICHPAVCKCRILKVKDFFFSSFKKNLAFLFPWYHLYLSISWKALYNARFTPEIYVYKHSVRFKEKNNRTT